MNRLCLGLCAAAILAIFPTLARAGFIGIDLSESINADLLGYSGGNNYQSGGSTLMVGGVPFALGLSGGNANSLGVVQSGPGATSFTFAAPSGTSATSVYVLMNTTSGFFGTPQGSITVTGTLGSTATLALIQGINIRGYSDGFFNTLLDPTVMGTYFSNGVASPTGPVQLDRQQYILPEEFFGDTITSITFNATNAQGSPFLAAMTLETTSSVPDSGATALLAALSLTALFIGKHATRRR